MAKPGRNRLRDRDRHAEFERVALVHVHSLYSMSLRLTRHRAEAEDLLQDTLVRAYRFFHRYQPGTNIKAWLFTILRNGFINRYRRAQRRPEEVDFSKFEESFESALERVETLKGPEQQVLDRSLDEPIEAALKALPEEYRSVLLLAVVEGLSYREIAAALQCPMGTVMSRLHRARKHMKAHLMNYARRRGIVRDAPQAKRPEAG